MLEQDDDEIPDKWIDIGLNHKLSLAYFRKQLSGIRLKHICLDGKESEDLITFTNSSWARAMKNNLTTWELEQLDPLTIYPSIECRACKDHGYVRNGLWVVA